MTRNTIPYFLLAAALLIYLLAGCATYGYKFTDADGSNVNVHDKSFLSKRDLADTASAYEWTDTGAGNWTIGQSLQGTNSTDALPIIQNIFTAFFAAAAEALKTFAPATTTPPTPTITEVSPPTFKP